MALVELKSANNIAETSTEDDFSVPLNMNDIIDICRDFNQIGWSVQNQIEEMLEFGVEEAITSGMIKQEAIPHIKYFLQRIISNPYFGEASAQAKDCMKLIMHFEEKYKLYSKSN